MALIKVQFLSDTPNGRDLPFCRNGEFANVTQNQLDKNGDILRKVGKVAEPKKTAAKNKAK